MASYPPEDPRYWTTYHFFSPTAALNQANAYRRAKHLPPLTRFPKPGQAATAKSPATTRGSALPSAKSGLPNSPILGHAQPRPGDTRASAQDITTWQKTLKAAGYDIKIDGKLGPQTKSALAHWARSHPGAIGPKIASAISGVPPQANLTVKAWNQHFGTQQTRSVVSTHTTPPVTGAQAANAGAASGAAGAAASSNDPTVSAFGKPYQAALIPLSSLKQYQGRIISPNMVNGVYAPLDASLAQTGATPLPADYADKLAGQQFDPQIALLKARMSKTDQMEAQALADIGNWYGQVQAHQAQATRADAEIGAAGVKSVQDAGTSIISSLGGGANPGAGVVGAQVANDVGTLAALKANQDSYNADTRPILADAKAEAQAKEQRYGIMQSQSLDAELASLQAQRAAAVAANQFEATKYNNDLKQQEADRQLQIMEYNRQEAADRLAAQLGIISNNNATRQNNANLVLGARQLNSQIGQQNFTNRFTVWQGNVGAALSGAKVATDQYKAATAAAAKANRPIAGLSASKAWTDLTPALGLRPSHGGQGMITHGTWQTAAQQVKAWLRAKGVRPGTQQWVAMGVQIMSGLVDNKGRGIPAGTLASWFR